MTDAKLGTQHLVPTFGPPGTRLAESQGRLGEIDPDAVTELRERLTVRDVAELFGITPSRVSQIHRRRA